MRRAKELLMGTDFTLEHIAGLCGFEHPEYMSVMFKRIYKQTPGEYRKAHSKPAKGKPSPRKLKPYDFK